MEPSVGRTRWVGSGIRQISYRAAFQQLCRGLERFIATDSRNRRNVDQVAGSVRVCEKDRHCTNGVAGATGAQRRVESALGELRLARLGGLVDAIPLQKPYHLLDGGESTLQAARRDECQVIERRVVLRITLIAGTHDRRDGKIDSGAAILPLVTSTVEKGIFHVVGC